MQASKHESKQVSSMRNWDGPTNLEPPEANWAQRLAVRAAIRFLGFLDKSRKSVFMLPRICIKYGPFTQTSEASTMLFISQKTNIPVPRVHCVFRRKGQTYIVMERIQGQSIGAGWHERSEESRNKLLLQLRAHVKSMRSISRPSSAVMNVNAGAFYDMRFGEPSFYHGPFTSVHNFHEHLRNGIKADPKWPDRVNRLIALHDQHDAPPVFTHGDLNCRNIIVEGDNITGIIDWETAGWLPPYWEYTSVCQMNIKSIFWRDEVDKFIEPLPIALEMENLRQEFFGDTN